MRPLTHKLSFQVPLPTEEEPKSDKERLLETLHPGFGDVKLEFSVIKSLYTALRSQEGQVTATLLFTGEEWRVIALEAGNTTAFHYGLAVDLGSTSITMELLDLNHGTVIGEAAKYNAQREIGTDILTRIFYGKDNEEHLKELQQLAVSTISDLMEELHAETGVDTRQCSIMVLAGNTTMVHFLLGLDGFPLFLSPYAPIITDPGFFPAKEIGLSMAGYLYVFPSKANYMGGDIISGMVATGIARSEGIQLFFDIGTNGELVVGCKDFLVAGAGAAGPALEGGVIRTGMCAANGAVEKVSIRGDKVRLSVIGGGKVAGICGSGIVDMIAELFLEGIIDFRGRFQPEHSARVSKVDNEWAFCYADGKRTVTGEPLYFYESDIRQFLDTKAAAWTMVAYMLDAVGITFDDVECFSVAGAFGTYIDRKSAITIGLYPDLPANRVASVGNSSLVGARTLLLERNRLSDIESILRRMDYIQYGAIPNFVEVMQAAAAIPHLDISRYPSVTKWLQKRKESKEDK